MKEVKEEEKSIVDKAWKIVREAFKNETDKAGTPYIVHLTNVWQTVKNWRPEDENAQSVALLHDLIEDIPEWSLEDLREHFPTEVVDAVEAITKVKGEPYNDYIDRVSNNELATVVKLADLQDNMGKTKANDANEEDESRLKRLRKYEKAYERLSS